MVLTLPLHYRYIAVTLPLQVKPKMVLTLLAAAMQQDMLRRHLGRAEVLRELHHFREAEQAVARPSGSRGTSSSSSSKGGAASPGRKPPGTAPGLAPGKGLASPGRGLAHSKLMEEDADSGAGRPGGGFLGGLRSSMGFGPMNNKAGKTGPPRPMALKEMEIRSSEDKNRASYSTNL